MEIQYKDYIFEEYQKLLYKCNTGSEILYCDLIPRFFNFDKFSLFFTHVSQYQNKYKIKLPFPEVTEYWVDEDYAYILRKPLFDFDITKINIKSMIIDLLYTIHFTQTTNYHIGISTCNYTLNENNQFILNEPYMLFYLAFSEKHYFKILKQAITKLDPNSPYLPMLVETPDSILNLIKKISENE